jgi:hypothetical protein
MKKSTEITGTIKSLKDLAALFPRETQPQPIHDEPVGLHPGPSTKRSAKEQKKSRQKTKKEIEIKAAVSKVLPTNKRRTVSRVTHVWTEDIFGTPLARAPAGTPPARAVRVKDYRASLDAVDGIKALSVRVPTVGPSTSDRSEIASRLAAPIHNLIKKSQKLPETDLIVGLDIGSTSTKIAVRLPYSGAGTAQAVDAPAYLRADGHPYYWISALWEDAGGSYSLLPASGAREHISLKVEFLKAASEGKERDPAVYRMTAYITLMLRQSLGWFLRSNERLATTTQFLLGINIGFPAAALETQGVQSFFRQCCQAAGRLALSEQDVTNETVMRELEKTTRTSAVSGADDFVEVFPELSGAIAGFIASSESRTGTYVILDIGGLTLDCVFFKLTKNDVEARYDIYAADLCRYGADIVKHWIDLGNAKGDAQAALGNFFAETVLHAHAKLGQRAVGRSNRTIPEIPTLLIGGGRKSEVHRSAPVWAEKSIEHSHWAAKLKILDLAPSRGDIDTPLLKDQKVGRLLVAAGLSLPRIEIPSWTMSKDIPDAAPVARRDYSSRFVGPEQT